MIDKEDIDPFYKLYSKVGAENALAEAKLHKYLKELDNKRHVSEINRNNEIFQERVIARELKRNADKVKRAHTFENLAEFSNLDTVDGTMSFISTLKSGYQNDSLAESHDSICISGYRLTTSDVRPRMFFWSQDASTKLPAPTAFYGYELGLNRPLTEVKLLGQDVYHGTRRQGTQSAEPRPVKETVAPLRNVHTSHYPRAAEREFLNLERSKTDIPFRKETKETIPLINLAKTKNFSKISDLVESPPKCDTEELNIDLKKRSKTQENRNQNKTVQVLAGDPKAIDSVRRPRRKIAQMLRSFKTREEARRCYREMLMRSSCSRNCHLSRNDTELDSTYNEIPVLVSEINKLKTDVEQDATLDGKPYTKSLFGVNMQSSISKKVLNKKGLPVAFRKSNNTFLKHYGGSIMEMRTPRHYNTPDIYLETDF